MHTEMTSDIKELYAVNQQINDIIGGKYRDYIGDLNNAITLTIDGWRLSVNQSWGGWVANYYGCPFPGARRNRNIGGIGNTAAESICHAYLAFATQEPRP